MTAVITNKFRSHVGLRDPYTVEQPIENVIHYLKDNAGIPLINGVLDECCLNTVDSVLYRYNGSAWFAQMIVDTSMCFLFSDSGFINAGNGHNIPDMMIYQKELDGTFSKRYSNSGVIVLIKKQSKNHEENCLRVYKQSTDEWVAPYAASSGSGSTPEEIDDRVAALLQEGEAIDLLYNDVANTLTVSCELADVGDNTVNKGVASFSDDSFGSTSGFVTLEKVDGGEWSP